MYNMSLECDIDDAVLTLDLAGGKVGAYDQAEYFVEAPALGTSVVAQVTYDCSSFYGYNYNTTFVNMTANT